MKRTPGFTHLAALVAMVVVLCLPAASGSAPRAVWIARYDSPRHGSDELAGMAVDPTGSVIVTGTSCADPDGSVGCDVATVKYGPTGRALWTRRYADPRNGWDQAVGLAVDAAGNVYVTGNSFSGDVDADDFYEEVVTLAYGPAGNLLWEAHREGLEATAIAADPTGNVYVAGFTRRASQPWDEDLRLIKYGPDGKELWWRRFDNSRLRDVVRILALDAAGNVYAVGTSFTSGGETWWYLAAKYAPDGTLLWSRTYAYGDASAAAVDAAGNLYITGYIPPERGRFDGGATVKYDSSGQLQWAAPLLAYLHAVAADGAGGAYVTGQAAGGGGLESLLVRYEAAGTPAWEQRFPGYATAIARDGGGNPCVAAMAREQESEEVTDDFLALKFDPAGGPLWSLRHYRQEADSPRWIAADGEGSLYVAGDFTGSRAAPDFGIVKVGTGPVVGPVLAGLTAAPASVRRGRPVTVRVSLTEPVKETTEVPLATSDSAALPVPADGVRVRAGRSTGQAVLRARRVDAPVAVTLMASYGGESREAVVTVRP